jgi:hypothetical protein
MRILTVTLCAVLAALACQAQNPKIKYGKITPQELDKKVYSIDSNANAIILSDVGETKIVGNNKGSFSLVFKRHKRIHILNKNGYDEANVQIPLYTNGSSTEELDNLKAVTYNLEAGKIVETKLEKAGVFSETRSRNLVIKKFTFPNVKEGSVIEYTYLIQSDFLSNLQPWTFQDRNPVLWSEYNVSIPEFLNYVFLSQGTLSFFEKSRKDHSEEYKVSNSARSIETERGSISASVADYHWAMKDVPELKEENFTSSLENYKAKIDFQLTAIQRPLEYQNLLGSWQEISKKLLEDEDFGRNLSTSNAWMGDVVKPLLAGATSDKEKAQRIFAFIRDNITCTSHYGFYTSQPLKNILKNKNGRVSDVNLLLTAMLRYAEIKADPVILSTKENGFTYPIYP